MFGRRAEGRFVLRPIMERRRVEVRAARPNDRMNLGVESDLSESRRGKAERRVK